jgi:hypothetical protein
MELQGVPVRTANQITFSGLRTVMDWSPTGVVVYKTAAGWMARKDQAVLVAENAKTPRIWKDLDKAVEQLRQLGAREVKLELA